MLNFRERQNIKCRAFEKTELLLRESRNGFDTNFTNSHKLKACKADRK